MMNALQKILVLAAVLVGASQALAGDYVVYNGQTTSGFRVPAPSTCNCGCKGDRHEHERRHKNHGGVDEFEPNSKREMALQIFTGQEQLHTINPDGDEDWIMFVPRQSGRYVLELTNVTIDLEGEIWAQSGRDNERRVKKFEVRRGRNAAIHLDVTARVGYFKVRVEADDNDDVGRYRLSVRQLTASGASDAVRRPDIFESDNRREMAIGIADNTTQLHTIYPRDDEDWLMFEPTHTGEYVLKISNVTADLKGELWVQRGDDKERRIEKFDVSRRGLTMVLQAGPAVRYFKVRIEADDNDDTGDYRVDVVAKPVIISPVVIRPTMRTPPIYREQTTIYTRPAPRHYPSRSIGIIPRILGSVLLNTGKVRIGVGVGVGGSHRSSTWSHGRARTMSSYRSRSSGRSSHTWTPSRTVGRSHSRSSGHRR
jgi:hypothetical protein